MEPLSAPISIHTTSRPPTDADIAQHSCIRLDALRTNPESFLSTYERESKFDRAKWREKLEEEGVWTFYAKCDHRHGFHSVPTRVSRALHHSSSSRAPSEGRNSDTFVSATYLKPWLATMTLLSPSFLTPFIGSSCPMPVTSDPTCSSTSAWPFSLLGPETDLWLIVGLWVRPEWRRKGVGQKIVQKAVHFVINSVKQSHSNGTTTSTAVQSPAGSKTTLVLLEVYPRNRPAIEFYQSVGFEILSDPSRPAPPGAAQFQTFGTVRRGEAPKTHWMGYTVPHLFTHRSHL